MDRPGLQQLLTDIDRGRIDVVVVYKVDRLTRSLADFAKIVERFDATGVSFVSVTQAFNTTSSMGRLTLNVLLSFAQFEREVTGERIRDKIAASKAKGMWMGGGLPLGYDRPAPSEPHTILVNPVEVETVRTIFRRYLELGSVHVLARELKADGVLSKAHMTKAGKPMGGLPFSRGALFHLLRSRTYLGEVPHKEKSYPGRHAAIIEPELFEAVQVRLASNAIVRRERPTRVSASPLRRKLFDADGRPMTPVFCRGRAGRTYRYYVSTALQQGQRVVDIEGAIRRIPAQALDDLALERLRRMAPRRAEQSGWPTFQPMLHRVEIHPHCVRLVLLRSAVITPGSDPDAEVQRLQRRLADEDYAAFHPDDDGLILITVPVRMRLRGGRTWLTRPNGARVGSTTHRDAALIKALRAAHRVAAANGFHPTASFDSLLAARGVNDPHERALPPLAFLAPDIQQAILEGRQPPGLTISYLLRTNLPVSWAQQRTLLGFASR